jgi:hypothetical protein
MVAFGVRMVLLAGLLITSGNDFFPELAQRRYPLFWLAAGLAPLQFCMDSDGDQQLIVFRCEPFFEVKGIARRKIREYFRR